MLTSAAKVPDGEDRSPDFTGKAYAPPTGASSEDAADLGRRQGSMAVACVPIAALVLAATIAITRATQSRVVGMVGFAVVMLVGFGGAGFGISSLQKREMTAGRNQGFSAGVFFAAFLNGLLAVAGGFLAYVLLVVPDD